MALTEAEGREEGGGRWWWEWFWNSEAVVAVCSLGARPAWMFFSSRFLDLVVIGRFNLCYRAI
jgi:hypothetical protein